VISVLHDEEIERLERLAERAEVGKRDNWVGGDDPQRPYASVERRLDDVGIRQAARARNALLGHAPELCQLAPIVGVLELAVARQARRKPGLARPHGIALAGDRKRRRTRAPDVAGDQRERVDLIDGL